MKEDRFEALVTEVKEEFPNFYIEKKSDSTVMKFIDGFLKTVTLGNMNLFMTSFITTLGTTVYVPDGWNKWSVASRLEILRHERVHMRQAKKYGRILFSLAYLLFPLPFGCAYFRTKFEKEAYEESLRALYEYHGPDVFSVELKNSFVRHFTTSEYLWMWPWKSSIETWYDSTVEKIKNS